MAAVYTVYTCRQHPDFTICVCKHPFSQVGDIKNDVPITPENFKLRRILALHINSPS